MPDDEEISETAAHPEALGVFCQAPITRLGEAVGESIPPACEDWANTKAVYRFFSNERVSECEILAGHFQSTRKRAAIADGPIFVMHDTTEFSFQRDDHKPVGITRTVNHGPYRERRPYVHTLCGILMHSSLVLTADGVPLGLAAVKFWTRKKLKGSASLKRKINPTRVPIEKKESIRWLENLRQSTELLGDPARCIHIGDRESDIYELFCVAQEIGTHFVIRACNDRLAGDGDHTIAEEMQEVAVKGLHRIEVRDSKGDPDRAVVEIRYRRLRVLPPIGKQRRYPALPLTVIHAEERGTPKNRARISWKLLTDLPVRSCGEAIEKLRWYALRWRIEVFHKILKSGCKAEESKLRTAQRLANLGNL